MLTPDTLREGFYDPKLGMLKIGILLASLRPDDVKDMMMCRTLSEVAIVANIPTCESLSDSGFKLLDEWLKSNGLL
jgi:hypothetical protein